MPPKPIPSRERLLEAAAEEFARHGFAGARIDAIAGRTRLNVRMIYYHFRSKEGLYLEVLEAIYRHMATVLDGADTPASPVLAFERYIDLLGQHPRFADILVREIIEGGKRLERLFETHPDLYESVHVRARKMLEESIQGGILRQVEPDLAVHSLTGMVVLLIAARAAQPLFLQGRVVEPSEWKATLLDLFMHGLVRK